MTVLVSAAAVLARALAGDFTLMRILSTAIRIQIFGTVSKLVVRRSEC